MLSRVRLPGAQGVPRVRIFARSDVRLGEEQRGVTDVSPRAFERVAEVAAAGHPAVADARGRLEDQTLVLELHSRRAREIADTLRDVQRRVLEALHEHELPVGDVDVILTGFEKTNPQGSLE